MPKRLCAKCRGQFDVSGLALAYRRLVLWFGVELISPLIAMAGFPGVQVLVVFVTLVALTVYAYRTAKALGSDVAWLWGVAMFVPCLNAITLLVISSKATAACREHGVEVGLFGPKL
jgi:hypothetical protein